MITLAELADKISKSLSKTETEALHMLHKGRVADFSKGEKIDLTQIHDWGHERTIRADFILWLCSDPVKVKELEHYGLRVRGARIEGPLNLSTIKISINVSLRECFIPDPIDLRHSSIPSLDLSGSRTARIDADCLSVNRNLCLSEGFRADGPVSLIGASIKGDLICVRGHFDNLSDQQETTEITGCGDCRASTLHAYSLVLERAKVEGSLKLCGGFTAKGGVHLGDATIGVNLNCTKGKFTARTHEAHLAGKSTGRRLACEGDAEHHLACAFNGEGMHVKGNLIMNGVVVDGETRLTSAVIDGDLDSADGKYFNQKANAIHGDRLRVRGNVFYSDGFKAEGAVRLPRAEIGADLSFCNGNQITSNKDSHVLFCEGIRVQGSVCLKNFEAKDGYVDISYSTVGGNLNCTDIRLLSTGEFALKAKGMEITGSIFLENLQADALVCLSGARLGMDLICTNGQFKSNRLNKLEDDTPSAIDADNMTIGGKVEMDGKNFKSFGTVNLDYSKIGSYLNCRQGTFNAPAAEGKHIYAISAGKLHVSGSIYISNEFTANGMVMLNDALIGRNLICDNGTIIHEKGRTLWAQQMNVAGSVIMKNFVSHGEARIDYTVIGGDLDCSKGEFINDQEKKPRQENPDGESWKRYALRADGVKIAGCAMFKDGFHVDGIVSFQNADIGMRFLWTHIRDQGKAMLFLDQAKAGVLEDDEGSWPAKNNLQINDFEYQFLKELSAEGLKKRREKWLGVPQDFRTQPYEHLAAVLKRSGYDEDAKKVLIEKNKAQTRLTVRWPWRRLLDRRCPPKNEYRQSQSFMAWIIRNILEVSVCYGYSPFKTLRYGLILVAIGWWLFSAGFHNYVMAPIKDGGCYSYQIAAITSPPIKSNQNAVADNKCQERKPQNISGDLSFYPLFYSLDTFLPVVDLQTADYWLPTAHPPDPEVVCNWGLFFNSSRAFLGGFLCCYRWVLIASGWVISTFFLAALSGIVRK